MIKIKTDSKTVPMEIQMLADMIGEEVSTGARGPYQAKKATKKIADMTDEELRAYKAKKQSERRQKLADQLEDGKVPFASETIREALADAAIMLLHSGGEGSQNIQAYLSKLFADKPAAVINLTAQARKGKLKPRLLKVLSK